MQTKSYDIVVAKEYETTINGTVQKRTAWNKVGRAWNSKSSESISFELFFLPNVRYVVQLQERLKVKEPVALFEDFNPTPKGEN